ncbi:MAG: carboxymuconolactone decarboxylase family protein [Acidobacteriota bacterium]
MSLIPFVEPEQASEEVKRIWQEATRAFAPVLGPGAEGYIPVGVKTLAHRPSILQGFWAFDQATFGPGVLDDKLKVLAGLRTSLVNRSNYCATHLYHFGRATGLTDDTILAIGDFEGSPQFSGKEKLAMRFASELTAKPGAVDKGILEGLTATFSPPEIVELTMVICIMNVLNRLHLTMEDEIDCALAPLALYPTPLKTVPAS